MLTRYYDINPLLPAYAPHLAVKRPVKLPVGGTYRKGRVLGLVTYATPVTEIRTLTITGTPTGATGTITFTHAGGAVTATLANAVTTIPTAAEMQTAFEAIFGVGNVTVTKSSLVYTITFGGLLSNTRIASNFSLSFTFTAGTTPAAAIAVGTRGHAGEGQYDVYDDAASDGTQTARALLVYDFLSDQYGGRLTENGISGQPHSPEAYFTGFFKCADLLGIDANGVTDLGKLVEGTGVTNPNAVLFVR